MKPFASITKEKNSEYKNYVYRIPLKYCHEIFNPAMEPTKQLLREPTESLIKLNF